MHVDFSYPGIIPVGETFPCYFKKMLTVWKLWEKYRIFIGLARDRTWDLCEHVHGLSMQTTTPLAQ